MIAKSTKVGEEAPLSTAGKNKKVALNGNPLQLTKNQNHQKRYCPKRSPTKII